MKYEAKLMVVRDIFPSEVLIDRMPVEDEFGRLRHPPHTRDPERDLHLSELANLFAFQLVPETGDELDIENVARIMMERLQDGAGPIHRLMEMPIPSRIEPEGDL